MNEATKQFYDKIENDRRFLFHHDNVTVGSGKYTRKKHYHNLFEIYYFTGGECNYFIDNKSYQLIPGDIVLIPEGVIHNSEYGNTVHSRMLINCSHKFIPSSVRHLLPQMLHLYNQSVRVGVGQTTEVMWAQLPLGTTDKGVTWTSSDERIATVDNNGLIRGVGCGKVTLNAKTNYGDAQASCTATVLIATPENIRLVNDTSKSITVQWDAVDGATGYVLYRSESLDREPVEYAYIEPDKTQFIDTDVIPGERYYYRLMTRAEIEDYNSDLSETLYTTARIKSPENVTASNYGALLSVKWSEVDEAKVYTVYRATDENGLYTIVGEVTATGFVDHNVRAGVTYYYKIIAGGNDRKTKSGYSQTVSVTARLDETVSLENAADFLPSQQPTPKKSNEAEISRTHFGVNNFIY